MTEAAASVRREPSENAVSRASSASPADDDVAVVARLRDAQDRIKREVAKVVVGQDDIIDSLLIGLLCRGHILLLGVPGLGKTLMGRTLARTLDMDFRRIQFTPDLMPSDITGADVLEEEQASGRYSVKFMRGPVFTNFLLADEINRTPPKTQAALLQAMQENEVTVGRETYDLPPPFFVVATQNPIEMEGTYPLPEAQLDRFMFNLRVKYPTIDEEVAIVKGTTSLHAAAAEAVLSHQHVVRLAGTRARRARRPTRPSATRPRSWRPRAPARDGRSIRCIHYISYGASPRASQYLVLGAKARAVLAGSYHVDFADIQAPALPVLRHRLVLNFHAARRKPRRRRTHRPPAGNLARGIEIVTATLASHEPVDPAFFAKLDNLELRARLVVEGFLQGLHRSPFVGYSVEFASHREYAVGDDLRHVNWKLFARQKRLYVKEYDAETNMNLYLLLDVSGSMQCASGGITKLQYGSTLAAALAYLALRQRDAVGVTLFADAVRSHLPPSSKPRQFEEIVRTIAATRQYPRSDAARSLHPAAELARHRGLVVIISDMMDNVDALVEGIEHLRFRRHEVVVFHILDPLERDLNISGSVPLS